VPSRHKLGRISETPEASDHVGGRPVYTIAVVKGDLLVVRAHHAPSNSWVTLSVIMTFIYEPGEASIERRPFSLLVLHFLQKDS